MAKFNIGDVVQLKSGGPKMTVSSSETSLGYHCTWFNGKKLEHGNFKEEILIMPEEEPKK